MRLIDTYYEKKEIAILSLKMETIKLEEELNLKIKCDNRRSS